MGRGTPISGSRFQVPWGPRSHGLSIAEELIPIILACNVWGHSWQGHQILCHCDNQVVVAALRSCTSKAKGLMHLLHCLAFVEAQHQCHIQPNTRANHLADDLSRDNLASFLSKVPSASPTPAPISSSLLELLLDPQADWITPSWRHQFSSIFKQATHRTYQAACRRFLAFCTRFSIYSPFPLTENLLCYFTDEGLAPLTGKAYLLALRNLQITLGFPDPSRQCPS